MVASHNQLHIDITADCTNAVDALQETKSQLRSLNHETASISVGLSGAQDATNQMEQVRQARMAAGGTVRVGVNSEGMDEGRQKIAEHRRAVQGLAGDLEPLGSRRTISVDSGGVRRASEDVDQFGRQSERSRASVEAMSGSVRAASDGHDAYGRSVRGAEQNTRGLISAHGDAERSFAGMSARADDLGSSIKSAGAQFAIQGRAVEEFGGSGERSLDRMSSAGERAARDADRHAGQIIKAWSSVGDVSNTPMPEMAMAGGGLEAAQKRQGHRTPRAVQQRASEARRARMSADGEQAPRPGTGNTPPPQGPPPSKGYGGGGGGDGEGEGGDDFSKWQREMDAQKGQGPSAPGFSRANTPDGEAEAAKRRAEQDAASKRAMDRIKGMSQADPDEEARKQADVDRLTGQDAQDRRLGSTRGDERANLSPKDEMRSLESEKRNLNKDRDRARDRRSEVAHAMGQPSETADEYDMRQAKERDENRDMKSRMAAARQRRDDLSNWRPGGPPGGGPPGGPPGGRGSGGAGDFSKWERELGGGRGAKDVAPEGLDFPRHTAFPTLAMGAVGVLEPVIAAAGAVEAFKQVVKDVPALANASASAMGRFHAGVRDAAQGAETDGVPAFNRLGEALGPLGETVGQVGKSQMGNVLSGATQLTKDATTSLNSLKPAFTPAVKGTSAALDSVTKGVGAPGVAQEIGDVGDSLQDKDLNKGIEGTTGGLMKLAAQTAHGLLLPAAKAILPALGGAGPTGESATGSHWYNEPLGKVLSDVTGNKIIAGPSGISPLGYDQKSDEGGAGVPGQGGGSFWNQQSRLGRLMTGLGSLFNTSPGSIGDTEHRLGNMFTGTADPNGIGLNEGQGLQDWSSTAPRPSGPIDQPVQPPASPIVPQGGGSVNTGGKARQWSQSFPGGGHTDFMSGISGPKSKHPGRPYTMGTQYDATGNVVGHSNSSAQSFPQYQGGPGGSYGGGDLAPFLSKVDGGGDRSPLVGGQSSLSSALPNASAVGAFSGMSDAASAAQGTPQQSSVPAQPPSQAQQQPPTPSQGQPPSPSQGQQSAAPQPSSGGGGDSGSGGADPKKIDSPRFDEPPEIGDLSAVPGQPGMFVGMVTNEFDNPQVSFNANTGKVTSINPNNQHEDVQGQPQTSLSHADVDGFGPAGRGYSQAMQSQVANSFSSKANPPDPYTMSMLNQSEHPDQTSHSQATAPGVGRGQAAAPGHGQGAPGLGVGHANMSQANPAQANAMANAPAALGAAPGMGQGLAAQAAVTAMSTALSSLSSHATQATQTQNSLAQSFGQVSQNSQANTQNQSQQNTAQQGLAQSNTSVSTSANSATNSVSNMSTAMDSTNASAQGLSQGAQSMSANVSDAVSGAQAGMAGLSSSMGQSGAQAGAAAMGGMAAGMSAGAADASASASDAGSGVGAAGADGAGDGAGAQSPSKKTRQIGLWLGEGLVIGMQNSAGSAVKAGKNLGQSAVDGAVAAQTAYNTTLAGGFGAGLIAASNGVTPIAQDYGLMLGYSWAQNVVTGAQSVFQSSQFTNLTTPQFASALAQRNEGLLGMLPPAGQGAEYYQTTSGSAGMVQMAPVVNATIQVSVDGTPLQVIAQNVVTASMNDLVDSINGQRG